MRLQTSVDERITGFVETYRHLCIASDERILSRQNMTITAVCPFAASMTIVELVSNDEWIIRLSGTEICERAGKNTTGMNALKLFSEREREIRVRLVESLFTKPCGIRAKLIESYENGSAAALDTISLPMLGKCGQQMVVNFALVTRDFEHPYGGRPVARRTRIVSHRYVDIGCRKSESFKNVQRSA